APEGFEGDRAPDAGALRAGKFCLGQADGEQEEDVVLAEGRVTREVDAQIVGRAGGVEVDAERSCAGARLVARSGAERVRCVAAAEVRRGVDFHVRAQARRIVEADAAPLDLEFTAAEENLSAALDFDVT